eukprot:1470226-Rhodomonas_salina.1
MAVKTTDTETGIGIQNWFAISQPISIERTSHTACFHQNLTINMPAATAQNMQSSIPTQLPMSGGAQGIPSPPTVSINTTPVPQKAPVPPPALPSMPAGGLEPLSFSGPVHPATPRGLLMSMPEPNAELRATMNWANSALKAPVRVRMPAPGAAKIGMKPVRESKPKASKLNISLPCKVTSVYMCADKAEVEEGEEKKIWAIKLQIENSYQLMGDLTDPPYPFEAFRFDCVKHVWYNLTKSEKIFHSITAWAEKKAMGHCVKFIDACQNYKETMAVTQIDIGIGWEGEEDTGEDVEWVNLSGEI